MKPGIYKGLPFADYLKIPAWNASAIKALHHSYMAWAEAPAKSTPALAFGTLAHTAVLEPQKMEDIAIYPPVRWDGKKWVKWVCNGRHWEQYKAQHSACEAIVSAADYDAAEALADAVSRNPSAVESLQGDKEVTIVWIDPDWGLCKCRFDSLSDTIGADLKSTQDISPEGFSRSCLRYNYHIQAAWYMTGAAAVGIDLDEFRFVAVESSEPHDNAVYVASTSMMIAGDNDILRARHNYLEGKEAIFTGAHPGISLIDLPDWYYDDEDFQ